jgi:hypothetical protein
MSPATCFSARWVQHRFTESVLFLQVMCADMDDPADYSGFQVELWRKIAHDLGWSDSDWSFSCVDWTAMIDDLVDANGSCSFAAAGETVSLLQAAPSLCNAMPVVHATCAWDVTMNGA